ncbi:MAG: hypothetical protein ACLPR9_19505 [Acidimicrobiales bacterium]
MALSFLHRLVRRTIELLGAHRLTGLEKDIEIIVLRHQLEVVHGHTPRPRFTWSDRAIVAFAAVILPRRRWSSLLVTPATDSTGLAAQRRPEALGPSPRRTRASGAA